MKKWPAHEILCIMIDDIEDREIVRKKPVAFCYSVECISRVRILKMKEARVYTKVVISDVPFGRNMCPHCGHALVWGNENDIIKYYSNEDRLK